MVAVLTDFLFLGSKITVDGDCSHEIRRWVLLGRKAVTNLDSLLKSRDIILPVKGTYSQGYGLPSGHIQGFFLFFIFISWMLITLQYCSGFCHTLTWISHGVTCIPHPNPPSHLPLYPIPLGLPSAPGPSACLMHSTWAGDLFHPR